MWCLLYFIVKPRESWKWDFFPAQSKKKICLNQIKGTWFSYLYLRRKCAPRLLFFACIHTPNYDKYSILSFSKSAGSFTWEHLKQTNHKWPGWIQAYCNTIDLRICFWTVRTLVYMSQVSIGKSLLCVVCADIWSVLFYIWAVGTRPFPKLMS